MIPRIIGIPRRHRVPVGWAEERIDMSAHTPIAAAGPDPERAGRGACLARFSAQASGGGPAGRRGPPSRRMHERAGR